MTDLKQAVICALGNVESIDIIYTDCLVVDVLLETFTVVVLKLRVAGARVLYLLFEYLLLDRNKGTIELVLYVENAVQLGNDGRLSHQRERSGKQE